MEPQTLEVIDVEVVKTSPLNSESIRWYTAAEAQGETALNKPAFQRAIKKLTDIYGLQLASLRRGGARATEYSALAVKAVILLESKKFSELRGLVEESPAAEVDQSAIVFVDRHHQIATTATTAADGNLAQISSLKSELLASYREAGRAWGKQAAAEVQLGFTEEVAIGIKKLQQS